MTAGRSASLCWSLLCVCVLLVSADQKTITADPGQTVALPCRAPNNKIICITEWIRADLGTEYVFFYREMIPVPDNQHPAFVNRVDLQDRQMKDGDVSLVLQNVAINDTGRYECHVLPCRLLQSSLRGDPVCVVYLSVVAPPGPTGGTTEDGSVGLTVGLSVFAVLVVALIVFLICKKYTQHQHSHQPPTELDDIINAAGD